MRTIAIVNQKGGCGKTTTAINLAAAFAARGYRTLLVDLDPQSHCAAGLGIPEERIELDVGDALLMPKERPLPRQRLLWRVAHNLDLLPSRMRLAGVEASRGGLADHAERERRLAMALERLAMPGTDDDSDGYEIVVVDCPPSIGLLTYNALAAADDVLIPVETSYFSLRGATKQVQTVRSLGKRFGRHPRVRLVATVHNRESTLARDLLRELRDRFGNAVLPGVVREDHRIREAASLGRTVLDFAPESDGAQDHLSLCEWLIEGDGIDPPAETTNLSPADRPTDPEGVRVLTRGLTRESGGEAGTAPAAASVAVAASGPTTTEGRVRDRIAELAARAQELRQRVANTRPDAKPTAPAPASAPAPMPSRADAKPVAVEVLPEARPKVTDTPLASVRSLFGVRRTSRGLLFVQPVSCGRHIAIAGSFNGWSPSAGEMRRNDELGVFELHVETDGGQHEYRLVVDGAWTCDPFNNERRKNHFGEENNLAAARV